MAGTQKEERASRGSSSSSSSMDRAHVAERVLALDLEMTDIADVRTGRIMEVGAVILGAGMEWLTREAAGGANTVYHRVLSLTEEELAASSEWSKLHHSRRRPDSGLSLMQLCRASPFSLAEVERDLVALVQVHGQGRPMMLAGSSVACDRVFIDHHMPRLSALLHHRTVDVSTLLELCRRMYPGFRVPAPRGMQHTALGDIVSSVRLLHYFQNTLFMPMLLSPRPFGDSPPGHAKLREYDGGLRPAAKVMRAVPADFGPAKLQGAAVPEQLAPQGMWAEGVPRSSAAKVSGSREDGYACGSGSGGASSLPYSRTGPHFRPRQPHYHHPAHTQFSPFPLGFADNPLPRDSFVMRRAPPCSEPPEGAAGAERRPSLGPHHGSASVPIAALASHG
jgi:oligoribonuclease (3'-5' exoribonuclease)